MNDTNNTLMTSSKGPGVEKGTWVSQWMKLHGKAEGNQWLQATALLGAAVLSTWPSLLHVVLSSACERGAQFVTLEIETFLFEKCETTVPYLLCGLGRHFGNVVLNR